MDGLSVTLNGFGDFLDGRTVHFVGPCPTTNVCVSCGVLNFSVNLPECSHAFCLSCSEMNFNLRSSLCPLDGQRVSLENVKVSRLDESAVAEYYVRCLNAPHGCQFEGRLAELEQHVLQHCLYNLVACWKCKKWMILSQFAEHTVTCSIPATATVLPSKRSDRIRRKETKGAVNDTSDSSKTASEPVDPAGNGAFLKEAARGEHHDACNANPKDQMPPLRSKCPALPIDEGVVKLATHQQPYEVESLEADATKAISALSSPISNSRKAFETNERSSTTCKPDADNESEVSQERKSIARQKTLGLRMKRGTEIGATASNATLVNTALMLGANDRTAVPADMLTSPSGALENATSTTFDNAIAPEAKAGSDRHLGTVTARVRKSSSERWTGARLQASGELDTDTADSDSEEQSALRNADSAESSSGGSEKSTALGISRSSRRHDSDNASRKHRTRRSIGGTITEEASGAFGSNATSYAGPDREEYEPISIHQDMYGLRKVALTFSVPFGVSTLDSGKQLVALSDRGKLHGYAFRMTCHFRGLGGLTLLAFGLLLCSEECDDLCPWPFDMNVILEVVHPRKDARNMRVKLHTGQAVAALPLHNLEPRSTIPRFLSQYYAWSSVVKAGFVADGTLCVDVWFQ